MSKEIRPGNWKTFICLLLGTHDDVVFGHWWNTPASVPDVMCLRCRRTVRY